MTRRTGALLVLIVVAGAVALRAALSAGTSPRERIESMFEDLQELRFEVNTCMAAMDFDERAVERRLAGTDSLRARIDALEALDPRGIPRDSFPVYMELVDRFNARVAAWDTIGEQARSSRDECEILVERHNVLGDSLRSYLMEQGLVPDSIATLP